MCIHCENVARLARAENPPYRAPWWRHPMFVAMEFIVVVGGFLWWYL